jgi:hypothetical protein
VAARLKQETDAQVETKRGGLGELSVTINDRKVIDTNRFWYPTPGKIVNKVKALLSEQL